MLLLALLLAAQPADGASTPTAIAPQPPAAALAAVPITVRRSRTIAGLSFDILAVALDGANAERACDAALDEIARVVALFSTASPDSALSRVNAAAGKDAVVVDPEVFAVLVELQRIARLSRGAFDLTAGVYEEAWRFDDTEGPPQPPPRAEIDRLRRLVSVDDLVLEPVARTARLLKAGAALDLRGVVKGYALARARAVLTAYGVNDFVLSCDGDVVVGGQKGDRPWMVGVQDPRAAGPFLALPVDTATLGGAVMTSSDNENYFLAGGVRYHSILDPRTGLPATRSRSVTVLHEDPLVADALARAVFVLGDKDGLALIERLPGAHAVIVTADNRVVLSKTLQRLAAAQALQQRPPTDGP